MTFRLFLLWMIFIGCSDSKEVSPITEFNGVAMTIPYTIKIGSSLSSDQIKLAQRIIDNTFQEVDCIYNKWNPHSELSKINREKGNKPIQLSPKLSSFLSRVNDLVVLTEGRFDPTIEPAQQLWKSYLIQGKIPSLSDIDQLREIVGWHHLHFNGDYLTKANEQVSIDLGGVAKGYTVDQISERLSNGGFTSHLVEWGGEMRASGEHPDRRPWTVFISRLGLSDPKRAIDHIELNNQSIATSGDYLQNWTVKDDQGIAVYTHIINPHTLSPLKASFTSVATASVLANSCMEADALATALLVFTSVEESREWSKRIKPSTPSIHVWIESRNSLSN